MKLSLPLAVSALGALAPLAWARPPFYSVDYCALDIWCHTDAECSQQPECRQMANYDPTFIFCGYWIHTQTCFVGFYSQASPSIRRREIESTAAGGLPAPTSTAPNSTAPAFAPTSDPQKGVDGVGGDGVDVDV
ncbi:hypothetical protein EMPG_12678 [Blastomyces silverae]|uniref:Extracellular membrane protein CFEM domain-containing protein n=1 Tax=Blastomyces silverae TaxID=2060906 RepID=A0A0H1BT11_9EURO|nr:hypothetical protein EMPG_12678 [Blastomyces silverae]